MLSNKDIRVENGNLIINGDKYPFASQADIDDIKDDLSEVETLTTNLATSIGDITETGIAGNTVASQLVTLDSAITYGAGDVISAENVVVSAVGANTSDCYFSVPMSKPVSALGVAVSDVTCNLYYGTNQMESIENATYTATIENGSLLVKIEKANTFTQYGRYMVDFTGTFTFS